MMCAGGRESVSEKDFLENFRCFEKSEADLQKKLTLVVGANGARKTSLLESIALQ